MELFYDPDVALASATGDPFTAQDFIPPDSAAGGERGAEFFSPGVTQQALGFESPPGAIPLGPASSLIDPATGAPATTKEWFYNIDTQEVVDAAGLPAPFTFGTTPLSLSAPPAPAAVEEGPPTRTPEQEEEHRAARSGKLKAIALAAENAEREARGLKPLPEGTSPSWFESPTARFFGALALGAAGLGVPLLLSSGGAKRPSVSSQPTTVAGQTGQSALTRALTTAPGAGARDRALLTPAGAQSEALVDADTGEIVFDSTGGRTGEQELEDTTRLSLSGQTALAQLLAESAKRELRTEVEQAPLERDLRMSALGTLPLFQAQPVTETTDPIQTGLESRLLRVLSDGFASKSLERRIDKNRDLLRTRLRRALGPSYEISTPGSQALTDFEESAEELRQDEERKEIQALSPSEESRRRFKEDLRGGGFREQLGLVQLGRRPSGTLGTGFSGLVPAAPLLGIETAADRRKTQDLQFDADLAEFNAAKTDRRTLALGIGNLFGLGASALLK